MYFNSSRYGFIILPGYLRRFCFNTQPVDKFGVLAILELLAYIVAVVPCSTLV